MAVVPLQQYGPAYEGSVMFQITDRVGLDLVSSFGTLELLFA